MNFHRYFQYYRTFLLHSIQFYNILLLHVFWRLRWINNVLSMTYIFHTYKWLIHSKCYTSIWNCTLDWPQWFFKYITYEEIFNDCAFITKFYQIYKNFFNSFCQIFSILRILHEKDNLRKQKKMIKYWRKRMITNPSSYEKKNFFQYLLLWKKNKNMIASFVIFDEK